MLVIAFILVGSFLLTFGYMSGRLHGGGSNNLAEPRRTMSSRDFLSILASAFLIALCITVIVIVLVLIFAAFGLFL